MTLEQLFYSLGSIFIISWMIVLIILIILAFLAFRRFRAFKKNIRENSVATAGLKLANPTSLKTFIALLPILQMGFNLLRKSKAKRRV